MSISGASMQGPGGRAENWWNLVSPSRTSAPQQPGAAGADPAERSLLETVTQQDRDIRARLLTDAGAGTPLLRSLTGRDGSPDFVAVRSGTSVTSQFSGGAERFESADTDGNNFVWFASANPPFKAVAVTYGPEATPEQRTQAQRFAMDYLHGHLDDRQDASGRWNRTLIEQLPSVDKRL